MLLTEQDTLRAISIAKANPEKPDVIAKAKAVADAYKRQQEAQGKPLFPETERARQDQATKLRSLFTDRERHGLDEDAFNQVALTFSDPEKKARFFNNQFLSSAFQKSTDEVRSLGSQYRDEYAKRVWGAPVATDKEFADRLGQEFNFEDAIGKAAQESALSGAKEFEALAKFDFENVENPLYKGREAKRQETFKKAFQAVKGELAGLEPTARVFVDELRNQMGAAETGATLPDEWFVETVMDLPKEKRGAFLDIVARRAGKGEQKTLFQAMAERFGRRSTDMVRNVGTASILRGLGEMGRQVIAGTISGQDLPEEFGIDPLNFIAGPAKAERAIKADTRNIRVPVEGSEEFAALPPEKQDALRRLERERDYLLTYEKINRIATGAIDPAESSNYYGKALLGVSSSLPNIVLAGAGPVGVALNVKSYQDQALVETIENNPGVSMSTARAMAGVQGLGQGVIDLIPAKIATGKLPGLTRWMNKAVATGKGAAGRAGIRVIGGATYEAGVELAQDVGIPGAVQDLAAALSEDIPGYDWSGHLEAFTSEESLSELIPSFLLLSFIGAGVGGVNDFKQARQLLGSYEELKTVVSSEAIAGEISSAAKAGDFDKAQSLLREEFQKTGRDAKTVQEIRVEAFPKLLQERERVRELVNRAGDLDMLPAIRNEGGGMWSLQYSDGSGISFNSYEEADARRWQVASDENLSLHEDTVSTIRQLDSAIEAGRETKYLFSLDDPTLADMQARGDVTAEAGAQRVQIAEETTADLRREYDEATTAAGLAAGSAEDRAASARILGQSVNEFRDEVIRTTVRLYQGATPLTLIEEKTEGDAKFMIGQLGLRKWMLSSLRAWEQASGDKLFRAVGDDQLNDQDIVEAWSALTQAYFVGRSKKGDQGPVFTGSRRNIAKLLSSPLGSAMTGYARLFRAVWRRAAMIEKARRDGTFDGDLEDFLARSTGISEQRLFERDVVREGAALASQISGNVSDNAGSGSPVNDNGATFSLLPSSETDTEYLAAVERGDMETAQRMVDEAARAAGYDTRAFHGTSDYGFTVFDASKLGGKTGAASAKKAFFFTSKREVAESYTYLGEGDLFAELQSEFDDLSRKMDALMAESINRDLDDLDDLSERYNAISKQRDAVAAKLHSGRMARGSVIDAGGVPEKAPGAGIYSVYLRIDSPIEVDFKGESQRPETFADLIDRADSVGRDAVIIRNTQDNATIDAAGIVSDVYAILANPGGRRVRLPQGGAAGIVGGAQILSGASRIKSADPVTYDESGNVIPLSQRFNPARDEITYSLLPDASNLDTEFARMFSPFQRSPELRMKLGQEMLKRVLEIVQKLRPILRANRTKKDIEAERKKRQDELFSEKLDTLSPGEIAALSNENLLTDSGVTPILDEILRENTRTTKTGRKVRYWTGSLMSKSEAKRRGIDTTGGEWDAIPEGLPPYVYGGSLAPDQAASMFNFETPEAFFDALASEIQSRADRKAEVEAANRRIRELEREAREESRAWAEKALEERETVGTDRATLLGFLRALEAIKRALPAEVRGRIGGSVALAQLTRPAAMLDEIESRVEMIDRELERWMQKEATEQAEAFFEKVEKSKQDEAGKAAKGKKNLPEIYKVMALAKKAFKTMSAEEGQSEGLRLHGLVDSGAVADDDIAATLMAAELIPLFSGWNGKTRDEVIDGKTKRIRIAEPSDSAQKTAALEAAKRIWTEGVLEWKKRQTEIKERRDSIRTQGEADIAKASKLRTRDEQEILSKGRASLPGKFALNIMSFDGFFRWHLGDKSSVYQWITDSERKAANAYDDAVRNISKSVDDWFTKKAGSRFKGEKLRQRLAETRVKITPEKGEARELSQLQLITAKLIWRQEDGKRHMKGRRDDEGNIASSWSYGDGFMVQVDEAISEEALELMDFLSDAYDAEYEPLNRVYRKLFGIDLPKHLFYSPLTVKPEIKSDSGADPVTGFFSGGLSGIAGALKTRGTSIVEPDFKDALQVYVAHSMQMEHFKAFAELAREARAIFGRVSFRDQIKRASGDEGVTILDGLLEVLDKGGIRSSGVYLESTKTLEALTGRLSTMILFGKLQTIALNVTQLAAASVEMGPRTYWRQFAKLWFTPTDWAEALRTPYIQRRIAEMPPVIRQAIESNRKLGPSRLGDLNDKLGYGIAASDGFFTAGTYAMVYDWKKQEAARLGIAPESVESFARNETERIMDRLAQPTRKGARSIFENNMSAEGRALFNFFSESRKNLSLAAYAVGKDRSKLAGTAQFVVLSAAISALIRAGWQDLRDDDEEEDGAIWNLGKLGLEVAIDPVYGVPVFGGMIQDAIKAGFGFKTYGGTILESGQSAIPAARRMIAMDYDPEEIDRIAGDLNAILGAFGYFFREAAALTSLTNAVEDALKVYDNLTN